MKSPPMKVPLLDLTHQYERIGAELEEAALRVIRSGRYILGPEVAGFEKEVADYLDVRSAIGVSSGTDALLVALMAMGVGPGDEVVMPTYSFFATAGCVARLRARPVFVDVDDDTLNLTVDGVASALSSQTKAVIVVHLFGRAADVDALRELLDPRGIPIIEDAAQAIGTRLRGRMAGGLGSVAVFSFFPSKNLGALGDGGLVTTDNAELAEHIVLLRNHGQTRAYEHEAIGGNFRLDAVQAAMLSVKLGYLEEWTSARRNNAATWRRLFRQAGLDGIVRCPTDDPDRHAYHQFVIRVPARHRDAAIAAMHEAGIGCAVYYRVPFHRQPCFQPCTGEFPVADRASAESIALPIFPELREDEQSYIVETLSRVVFSG